MKCPNCDEQIFDDASFCPACGHRLNSDSQIYCPNCGELTRANSSFCRK